MGTVQSVDVTIKNETGETSSPLLLNERQLEAARLTEGPVLVIAGPGTGKTRVLTERVRYILEEGLASPFGILAVTFTRKAAAEIRERLAPALGPEVDDLNVGTIHAFGLKMVKAEAEALGYQADSLSIFDADRSLTLIRKTMRQSSSRTVALTADRVWQWITRAKERLLGPEDLQAAEGDLHQRVLGEIYQAYQEDLRENNAVDYPDLIRLPVRLLSDEPELLQRYQSQFSYILVDEFQDTSQAQYALLLLLAQAHQNIFCVGSPAQAIYSWRNAEVEIILQRFLEDFPDAAILVLDRNYRSTKTIVACAQHVISAYRYGEEEIWTEDPPGEPVQFVPLTSRDDEARFIAREIKTLVSESRHEYSHFAVLYRTNAQSRPLEQEFLRAKIPYTLVGTLRFFRRREVADVLAYLRVIHNPADSVSLERVINRPARGLGPRTLEALLAHEPLLTVEGIKRALSGDQLERAMREKLRAFLELFVELHAARENLYPAMLMDFLLEKTGYGDWLKNDPIGVKRRANLDELRKLAEPYSEGPPQEALQRFLEEIDLLAEADPLARSDGRIGVTLSTVHSAKGLEFPVVFVSGMEQGLFPHFRARTTGRMDEERRLFYVAITRARERLYLTWALRRDFEDQSWAREPSQFLSELPKEHARYRSGP